MKIKFTKDAFGRKANEEIEANEAEVKAYGDAVQPVVVNEVGDITAKAVDELLASVDEKLASFEKKLEKSIKSRKPTIHVGSDGIERDPQKGWKSAGEFLSATRKGYNSDSRFKESGLSYDELDGFEAPAPFSNRLMKSTGSNETTPADGGYAVPVNYADTIYEDIQQGPSLLPLVENWPIVKGNSTFVPADDTTTIGASGVLAYWVSEGVAPTISKAKARTFQLTPKKLAVLTYLTSELIQDNNVNFEGYVMRKASYAINYAATNAIVRGNGSGKPLGFIGHAATALQGRANAGAVGFADVARMRARFYGNVNAAVWLANPEVWAQLAQMTSGNYNIFLSNNAISGVPVMSMFGIPVLQSEHASTLGNDGDLCLIDPTAYASATIGGVNSSTSIHVKFAEDEVAYKWTFRIDGRPSRDAVLSPASGQGTKTLSPFVVLDDGTTISVP